jgi:hypothetical protein
MSNEAAFSAKVAAVLADYSALPFEAKAATLFKVRLIISTVKSRKARAILRQIEKHFESELKSDCSRFINLSPASVASVNLERSG